jgi:phospholipase C
MEDSRMKLFAAALVLVAGCGMNLADSQTADLTDPPAFRHIVIIVQENRTPDDLFQGLCAPPFGSAASCSAHLAPGQYDIQTNNWADKSSPTGVTQPQTVQLAAKYDLGHSHASFEAMCDSQAAQGPCRMDGTAGIHCTGICPIQPQFRFVDNSSATLDPYLRLAVEYGWANRMFQTNQGPSFPAHQFLFGGTSAPTAGDDAIGVFASENTGAQDAGCAAPAGTTVKLIDPGGLQNRVIYPCFEHPTMADLLPVSWRYYAPTPGSIWTAPNAIRHICQSSGPGGKCTGADWIGNVDLAPAGVLSDIANCRLSALSWVIPTAANSDHAGVNDGAGPSWVASIVNAIGAGSTCDGGAGYWTDTAIVITWDDWGGWYDHVAPTIPAGPEGDYQYGFRVPLIFVSAYTPRGLIDNATYDFGSILRFVERNFGVREGALFFADARAENDLRAFYDLQSPPRPYQAVAAPLSAAYFLSDTRPGAGPDAD